MFESANLDHKVSKDAYKRAEPKLRAALLDAQYDLKENGRFPVLVLIAGVEGAGKGETVNQLNEWMDSRHVLTHGFAGPSDEEHERPHLWRFWKALPPKGKVGVFFGAWHTDPIVARVHGRMSAGEFGEKIDEIVRLERMLCDEGVLLLKYWFHVPRKVQKRRLKALGEPTDYPYRKYTQVSETFVRRTSSAEAPWIIIAGADERYRALTFGRHLLAAMRERLDDKPVKRMPDRHPPLVPPADHLNLVRALELDQPLDKSECRRASTRCRASPASARPRWSPCSRATMPPAKVAPSAASRARSMRAIAAPFRSRRRPRRNAPSLTCGASGATCRAAGG